jgi:hypothetical protein
MKFEQPPIKEEKEINDPALSDLYRHADDMGKYKRDLEQIKSTAEEISSKLYELGVMSLPPESKLGEAYISASQIKESYSDVDQAQSAMQRIAKLISESDGFKEASKKMNDGNFDGSVTAEQIKDFEKEKGVDQDIIAKSLLVHSERHNYLLNKIDEMVAKNPDYNPDNKDQRLEVYTLRNELDDVRKIMKPMIEHLTKDTIKKYKEDFELHQVFAKELLDEIDNN